MNGSDNSWLMKRRASRRRFLATGGAGVTAFILACGGGSDKGGSSTSNQGGQPGTPGVAVGGATAAAGGTLRRGGELLVSSSLQPSSLDPQTGTSGGDHTYFWTMFDNLVAYDRKAVPDTKLSLAESWEQPDQTTILFKLRQGVKFHDGTAFDGQTVKWNIERVQNPDTKSSARAQILPVQQVEVPDAATVRFKLDKPNGALLALLGDRGGGMVSRAAVEKYGKDFGRNPVGTGPFKFVEWVQDSHVTVQRNPDYWGKDASGQALPYVDRLQFKILSDPTVRMANLQSGGVHVTDVQAVDVARIKSGTDFQYRQFDGTSWTGLYINQAMPPLDNINLRRALAYAVNRDTVAKNVFFGLTPTALGPITPAQWAYDSSLNAPKYDAKKAKDFLAAGGMPNGFRVKTISYPTPANTQMAELLQAQLNEVGIKLDIEMQDVATANDTMWVSRTSPMYLAGFSIRSDPDGMVSEAYHSQGFYNAGHLPNPDLDALIDKARSSYDLQERKKVYTTIQDTIANDVHTVFLVYAVGSAALAKKVQNSETLFGGEGKWRYKELWLSA
jgi:peptide/nickel transport system substrate-binding protein